MLRDCDLPTLIQYEPTTGRFFWLKTRGSAKAGHSAGTRKKDGYIRIKIGRREYPAHHLAWFFQTGAWPDNQIDHRDRDRSNNRWDNLRAASRSLNGANTVARASAAGLKGVSFQSRLKVCPYQAKIMVSRKAIHLGYFATAKEAHAEYMRAAEQYFGEFARAA